MYFLIDQSLNSNGFDFFCIYYTFVLGDDISNISSTSVLMGKTTSNSYYWETNVLEYRILHKLLTLSLS